MNGTTKMHESLTGFNSLISILELCPPDAPDPKVNWDAIDQDLELEWYFGGNNWVQLCIGSNFSPGTIYVKGLNKPTKSDYSKELLSKLLLEFTTSFNR